MHVFHSGFILIWEGRSHVRPGPILLCEHHYYTLNTCGNSHSSDEKSQVNQRVAPICGKNGCVFQFPQKTHAETDLPQG